MANVVICTNRFCGKEYHIDFEKCPFCGTENPQIEKLNEKKEQKRKDIAQKLEYEKKMEESSNGRYQSIFRILVEGGHFKSAKINIWEVIPTYAYIIGFISFMSCSIMGILLIFPQYSNNDWLQWGFVTSLSALFLFISHVVYSIILNKDFYVRPANGESPSLFNIWNSVGVIYLGDYRKVGNTHVSYVFFSIIFPLIPIGCYRVTEGGTTSYRKGATKVRSTSYKIYGSEKWSKLEILHVYLSSWSVKMLALCVVWLLFLLI